MPDSPRIKRLLGKYRTSERLDALTASALSQLVGYLRAEDFPDTTVFDSLPVRSFKPDRIIQCDKGLWVVKRGLVEVRHARQGYLVKKLMPGSLFGEMPLLGQTMLMTESVAGEAGATLAVMDEAKVGKLIEANPVAVAKILGPKLAAAVTNFYTLRFQPLDSRLAALLLELAGEGTTVEGLNQIEIGERIHSRREPVAHSIQYLKAKKIIKADRRRITLLDKEALRALAEW